METMETMETILAALSADYSHILLGLLTLTALEIVLGIDNIVVIAIIAGTLPPEQRERARVIGLVLAMVLRLLLLFTATWIASLTAPLIDLGVKAFSGRDLLMLGGGLFLIAKAVTEIHEAMDEAGRKDGSALRASSFASAISQIVVLDLVFSFDSVITAVGMVDEFWIMAVAIVIAVGIMLVSTGKVIGFIHAYPSVKMLALAFVILIGVSLTADGMGLHFPRGYLYFAMLFAALVEGLNVARAKKQRRAQS